MLGLRHYRGTAVDLFQGEIERFVCDAVITATDEAALRPELERADQLGVRHVSIVVPAGNKMTASAAIAVVKTHLEGARSVKAVKRLSIILATLEVYKAYQQALFEAFPEAE